MKRSLLNPRGSALITAAALTAVMLLAVGALVYYASQERGRAINISRTLTRAQCTEAGLQLARAYYGRNYDNWNTYLSNPTIYDPTATPTPADPWSHTLQQNHPELFADIDGDGNPDVYIYVRDNMDELPPASNNKQRDNDQIVIIGAICISSTLVPRHADGTSPETSTDPTARDGLTAEALLNFDAQGGPYKMGYGCGKGDGNLNACTN
jgi:hypothetical protein